MHRETLTFTLAVASTAHDLHAAAALRSEAYGRHSEAMRAPLAQPDMVDRRAGTRVLLARDKVSGEAVGTARIQFSRYSPLPLDACLTLPAPYTQAHRAEITRLAIARGADATVRLALFKACWQWCEAEAVDYLVIAARSPALLRIYEHLGMDALLAGDDWINLPYAGNLPHRVRALDMAAVRSRWLAERHPAMPFMVDTLHPDIEAPQLQPLPLAA